jgi:hypothetical protein
MQAAEVAVEVLAMLKDQAELAAVEQVRLQYSELPLLLMELLELQTEAVEAVALEVMYQAELAMVVLADLAMS